MGYTLLRKTIGKGGVSFLLSLLVAVSPVWCTAQATDSLSYPEGHLKVENDSRSESAPITATPPSIQNSSSESVTLSKSKKQFIPVLSFTVASLTVKEDVGAVNLRVELLEAGDTGVEVDVVFVEESGTASFSDLSDFRRQTVSFAPSDGRGTIKTVRVPIADDSEYEQSETAQFRLQNISTGSISEPSQLTLILQDDDTPDIVINEIFADPQDGTGDANGDGSVTARGDQFVEIVNNENETVDISGWTLSDRFGIRFRFPAGTELPAGTATVIFGAGDPSGSFGGARVFTTDDLGIDPTEDELFLKDNQNNIVERVAYAQRAKSGESLTRSDLNGSLSLQHSELPGSRNRLFSPGTKADGTSFGSRYALRLGGGEGWRLLSSPAQNTTFEELLGKFQMTTSGVSNQANRGGTIYEWQSGRFKAVDNIQRNMEAGKGYAIFFYRDDDPGNPGIQGGFPKMISTNAPEHNSPVPVTVSAVESAGSSGWNLMGNPFGTEISVDELLRTLRRALQIERPELQLNGNVYIWDPEANSGNGDYLALEEGVGHKILPFQAFWVRIDNVPEGENLSVSTNLERDELLAETTQRFKEGNREELRMTLSLGDGQRFDDYQLAFNREGEIGLDVQDAFKLHSINTNAISLFSLTGQQRLSKNVLPYDLNATIEIPLDFVAEGREALSFEWDGIEEIPDNWNIILTDKELNKEVDLRTAADYRFTVSTNTDQSNMQEESIDDPLHRKISTGNEPRFILAIRPGNAASTNSADIPESVKLNPNYPNPFNPATTISYELKEDSEVLLSIWNIVGQRVVTLVDGMKEAGQHTATWNASEMPSGIYIAQLEVGGEVFIRKMTLIK